NVDNSGIFSRPLNDLWSFGWQALQMDFGAFVTAMFAPHHAEDAKLCEVGLTSQDFDYACVLVLAEVMLRKNFWSHRYFGNHMSLGSAKSVLTSVRAHSRRSRKSANRRCSRAVVR